MIKKEELIGGKKIDSKFDVGKLTKEFFECKVKNNELKEKFNLKPYFRLHPPIKGFERKGIKMPFKKGGALGDREVKICDLILRML